MTTFPQQKLYLFSASALTTSSSALGYSPSLVQSMERSRKHHLHIAKHARHRGNVFYSNIRGIPNAAKTIYYLVVKYMPGHPQKTQKETVADKRWHSVTKQHASVPCKAHSLTFSN